MNNSLISRQFSLLMLAFLWLGQPALAQAAEREKLVIHTQKGRVMLMVDVARTPEQLQTGLMGVKTFPSNYGMLFDFGDSRMVEMWMKNTPSSLDMLFIDDGGMIHHIVERTTPYSLKHISSIVPVKAVLELPAGMARKKGIAHNDMVVHPIFHR